jgi:N-acyl-L-homoserine lactone synthetase
MKEFSSSTKVLTSFAESPQIRELTRLFGDRLSGLTRLEKYQLVTAIGQTMIEIANDENAERLKTVYDVSAPESYRWFPLVLKAIGILKGEDPANLAAILAPIAEYAREDDRLSC